MKILPERPVEGDTYAFHVVFTNLDGEPFTPKSCTWTLSDLVGTIINGREDVSKTITAGETSCDIVVFGDDLICADGDGSGCRVFTVEALEDSVKYGNNLPSREECRIDIRPTVIKPEIVTP